jgi:AcrR family transcriptional regulator
MPRPVLHAGDHVLDAARDLVLEGGPRAVGIRDISARSGAPSGSLYHRFGSRDALLARAWLRAARRFQAGFVAALDAAAEPGDAVAAAARWSVGFARTQSADARLLLGHSRAALLDAEPRGAVADELATVNAPIEKAVRDLAARVHGRPGIDALEWISYALIDLPLAVVRRHLLAGTLTDQTAARLAAACRCLVEHREESP